jgi:inorganic triphosphatase YgiF
MEVEAKYRVPTPADLDRVAGLSELGGYALRPHAAAEQQRNDYYDTADRRLQAARHGLRVRRVGERALVTLKGPSSRDGALFSRAEWEFAHDNPDPRSWPPGEARDVALAIIGEAALERTLTIETHRRAIDALRAGAPVAEICLDLGTIYAGGREAPICELEIELFAAGTLGDIYVLTAVLGAQIALEPEPLSKLARGLALLQTKEPSSNTT